MVEFESFRLKHPITDKHHYLSELMRGDIGYASTSLDFKNRILLYLDKVIARDEEIHSKLKTKQDLKEWKWKLDEIDEEYELIENRMEVVLDHLFAHNLNIGGLTGEVLLHCNDGMELYIDYTSALSKLSKIKEIMASRKRNPGYYISSSQWGGFCLWDQLSIQMA